MSGISALIKETPGAPLSLPPWGTQKSVTQKNTLTKTCWHPDLRLLASRTVRNECLLFISHPVCDVWLQPEWTKTPHTVPTSKDVEGPDSQNKITGTNGEARHLPRPRSHHTGTAF